MMFNEPMEYINSMISNAVLRKTRKKNKTTIDLAKKENGESSYFIHIFSWTPAAPDVMSLIVNTIHIDEPKTYQ